MARLRVRAVHRRGSVCVERRGSVCVERRGAALSRRLVLLRHGRTAWNAERRFQGHADPPLDEVGLAQAYEVAALVAALGPDLLLTSDQQRARGTARIVGAAVGLPALTEPAFRERGLGHWEGLTRDEVEARYPAQFARWVTGSDVAERGGETREAVAARAMAAFAALPVAPLTVVVTHSATAMALTNALLGIPQTAHPLGPLANCHWTELYAEPSSGGAEHWRLRGHNLGAPGTVTPMPRHDPVGDDEVSDADA